MTFEVIKIDKWKSKNRHKYLLQYHLIFVCKYRKKLLIKSIADDIKQLSYEICNKHNVTIKEMETDKDHIHYLNKTKSEIPLALDGGMNDNNRTAGTVGIAY